MELRAWLCLAAARASASTLLRPRPRLRLSLLLLFFRLAPTAAARAPRERCAHASVVARSCDADTRLCEHADAVLGGRERERDRALAGRKAARRVARPDGEGAGAGGGAVYPTIAACGQR